MATKNPYPLNADPVALQASADGAARQRAATSATTSPASDLQRPIKDALAAAACNRDLPPQGSCEQVIRLSFFFDGTGNNRDADIGTREHSNIVRLYNAHQDDNDIDQIYKFYIPGIGTYFKDIGDKGGGALGLGFGVFGQKRLDWVFQQFEQKLQAPIARAKNPSNKIRVIRVAVFGFSRGAALARAFCRDMQARCERSSSGFRLKRGGHPIEITFLGLFDTVASVGLPMSANALSLPPTIANLAQKLHGRAAGANGIVRGVEWLAFGEPGADPQPGVFDGHADWAKDLEIVPLVKNGVHMIAAHELRNSFPLDSVLQATKYPSGIEEMALPGAHSNVGGGYRPGEGARSPHYGSQLSLIPLRMMHERARAAGVPLVSYNALLPSEKQDYALDAEGSARYAALIDHYNHYMAAAGGGGKDIGADVLAHKRLYYRWRFHAIRRNQTARNAGQATQDDAKLEAEERNFRQDKAKLEATLAQKKKTLREAKQAQTRAEADRYKAMHKKLKYNTPIPDRVMHQSVKARADYVAAEEDYLREQAKYDTMPGVGTLSTLLKIYDERLLADAEIIRKKRQANPKLRLRPHYQALLEAYEDEFIHQRGLRDAKLIHFFDYYVHDSLADFATDLSLPSDPRVIYVGMDIMLKYAQNEDEEALA